MCGAGAQRAACRQLWSWLSEVPRAVVGVIQRLVQSELCDDILDPISYLAADCKKSVSYLWVEELFDECVVRSAVSAGCEIVCSLVVIRDLLVVVSDDVVDGVFFLGVPHKGLSDSNFSMVTNDHLEEEVVHKDFLAVAGGFKVFFFI
eukprot:s9417_g1.t1